MIRAKSQRARNRSPISAAAALIAAFAIAFVVTLIAAFAIALGSASVAQAVPPHGPYETVTGDCATCHRSHTGKNRNLLKSAAPVSNLCFTCHDGTGSTLNVLAQYTDALVPPNNVATRVFFRHDARVVSTPHTRASLSNDPLGALDRHSECTDCHNPHKVNAGTNSTMTTTGWTASSRQAGISGVSVDLPAANTARTYTFLDGITTPITREYQLCYKCHSGFTTQLADLAGAPSRNRLDKGMEFNPNNPSYHPVEAPGKNTSAKMVASLSGSSIYRRYTFLVGDTIRCSNCHVSSTTPTDALPGSNLSVHTSRNAGILRAPYRNRLLKPADEAFNAAEFALCFMCHATGPFATETTTATNFSRHGFHLTNLRGQATANATIDQAGAGGDNAICAECHFRIHSTTFKVGTQTIPGTRLVNFSPNVSASGGTISWTPGGTIGTGSCTLVCHGQTHSPKTYP